MKAKKKIKKVSRKDMKKIKGGGFGTFSVRDKKAREGRNPRTGQN